VIQDVVTALKSLIELQNPSPNAPSIPQEIITNSDSKEELNPSEHPQFVTTDIERLVTLFIKLLNEGKSHVQRLLTVYNYS